MNNFFQRILSSLILIPIVYFSISKGSFFLIILTFLSFMTCCYEWQKMTIKRNLKIFGFIFLFFSFSSFYLISSDRFLTFFVITICIASDTGGYFFGKIFKGPKLTNISPNKTYSGMAGSYILSIIIFLIIFFYADYPNNFFQLLIISFIISAANQIGDLIVSYFKRLSKIKDTGNIIPGHGGILDRIDGMIFAFPVIFLIDLTDILKI